MINACPKSLFYIASILVALWVLTGCATAPTREELDQKGRLWSPSEVIAELGGVDEYEGFNRSMFETQQFVMEYFVRPVGWVYASIIPKLLQCGIANIGDNIKYPRRVISALSMGKFSAAGWESLRFLTNTTLGIAGFFDVADDYWGLYPYEEDFGQVFAAWGMAKGPVIVLPGLQGISARDAGGAIPDMGLDPRTYLFFVGVPAVGGADAFNTAVYRYRTFRRLLEASSDPYEYYKSFLVLYRHVLNNDMLEKLYERRNNYYKLYANNMITPLQDDLPIDLPKPENMQGRLVHLKYYGAEHPEVDTLRSLLLVPQTDEISFWSHLGIWNRDFTSLATVGRLAMSPGRPELPFYHWQQPDDPGAPLVILIPGIGGDYTVNGIVALAEVLYQNGYQCVTVSNTCNWRFIESALSNKVAGYTTEDAKDLEKVLKQLLIQVESANETSPRAKILTGYSLGGLLSLFVAANEEASGLRFDRYVAINPPMNMKHAMNTVDNYGKISLTWTREDALNLIPDAVMSYFGIASTAHPYFDHEAGLLGHQSSSPRSYRIPVSVDQAKYGIWAAFRFNMRDMVAQAVKRDGALEGIKTPYTWNNRTQLYREIDQLNFTDYIGTFLLSSYRQSMNQADLTLEDFEVGVNGYEVVEKLKNDPRVRILHNQDDMFVSEDDKKFLDERMADRLIWFDHGGHLGNMYMVQWHNNFLASIEYAGGFESLSGAPKFELYSNDFIDRKTIKKGIKIAAVGVSLESLRQNWPKELMPAQIVREERISEADVLVYGVDPGIGAMDLRSKCIRYIMEARENRDETPKILIVPTRVATALESWNLQLLSSAINNMLEADYCRLLEYSSAPALQIENVLLNRKAAADLQ